MADADQGSTDSNLPAKAGDELSGELSLRANLDKSGLTVAAKSRTVSAFDRLLGGLVGLPAAWFEGARSRAEARNESREALIRADGTAALKQIEGMSGVGQAAMSRFLRDEYRKQDNRQAVVIQAHQALLSLPASGEPAETKPAQLALPGPESDVGPQADFAQDDGPPVIEEDWINIFADYADRASSDRLRILWGQILAGEIRKPGSFAPTTLRVIAEMDAEIARDFEQVIKHELNGFIYRAADASSGEKLSRIAFLEQVGLIQGQEGMTNITISVQNDRKAYLIGTKYILLMTIPASAPINTLQYPALRVTRTGMQIGAILEREEEAAMRELGASITGVETVHLVKIVSRLGTQFGHTTPGEKLK